MRTGSDVTLTPLPPARRSGAALTLVTMLIAAGCGGKKVAGAGGAAAAGGAGGGGAGGVGGVGMMAATPVPLTNPTQTQFLSGHGNDDAVTWDFYCASTLANNRNCTGTPTSGTWSTIPVPSNWELQGFGTYYYGTDNGFARGPGESGFYRYSFDVPAAWAGQRVMIAFEGSMTDTTVKINGVSAGPTHQGGFYRFKYDVSSLLQYGASNLLEVEVDDESANTSISSAERSADYWVFGGIFRPVYLESYPAQSIDHVAVDARADGTLSVDVSLQGLSADGQVTVQIFDPTATQVGATLTADVTAGQSMVTLGGTIAAVKTWSAETPFLYRARVALRVAPIEGGQSVHEVLETIGFRTVEVRVGDGLYVNGKRVMLRGVNRHSFWPSTGRALNAGLSHDDIVLLKGMNVNAVRSSHYPPDRHFLDAADAMGLYVLDELAGWQHAYDTPGGTPLVGEMVNFDVNHPSIIFWDNGNEGGWNTALDSSFGKFDPQHRSVLHPQQLFSGIQANHYPNYAALQSALAGPNIFMPTEFLHGLFDGGGGAGLDDFWTLMRGSARSAGGFVWAFLDEAVLRTDDPQNRLDTKGNQAPDGIAGPYREKEGSYNTIREIWSPVQPTLVALPDSLSIENRYDFTDASSVSFHWQLVDFDFLAPSAGHTVIAQGTARTGSIAPGASGDLSLTGVPPDWSLHHALLLDAQDATGQTIGQWSWMIASPQVIRQTAVAPTAATAATCNFSAGATMTATAAGITYAFNVTTGMLAGVSRGSSSFALQNGPTLTTGSGATQIASNGPLTSFTTAQDGGDCVLTAAYAGGLSQVVWRVMSSGWLRLTYRYSLTGSFDFFGVSFDYPEARVQSAQWLGKGPYRVWKNRMKGTTHDIWSRDYNDAITGETWTYPEFKGYFAGVDWLRLNTTDGIIHFVFDTSDDSFVRLFTAHDGPGPQTTQMVFPPPITPGGAAGLSFLQGIPAIGTKFDAAATLGPESQPSQLAGNPYEETVYMFFGEIADIPTVKP